jgi:arsenate reductase
MFNGTPVNVLILCTGNSCRSQMAEGILKSLDPRLDVRSAGTSPARGVHPKAVAVMKEIGIDISAARPKPVDDFLGGTFDYVVTVCDHANESCPVFTGSVRHRLHIGFEDPAEATGSDAGVTRKFREVRDGIREKFTELYRDRLAPRSITPPL